MEDPDLIEDLLAFTYATKEKKAMSKDTPVYSRKYGKTFKNRAALASYQYKDRYTNPIFPWFGIRDSIYSDEWKREHKLGKYKDPQPEWVAPFSIFVTLLLFVIAAMATCAKQ